MFPFKLAALFLMAAGVVQTYDLYKDAVVIVENVGDTFEKVSTVMEVVNLDGKN